MKKGRHRRFEEARALKRSNDMEDLGSIFAEDRPPEPCPECGSEPGAEHASWCMHDDELDED